MNILTFEEKINRYMKSHLSQPCDGAHDLGHLMRVVRSAKKIMSIEGGDPLVIIAASYLHDIVSLPKNHPERKCSSMFAAEKAKEILASDFPEFPTHLADEVGYAILTHSYSAGFTPKTLEAKILQDADRLDALGAIGLARVFYIAGALQQTLFDENDPFATLRPLDDKKFAVDHFQTKLLRLPEMMNTEEGRRIAIVNAEYLSTYLGKLAEEIGCDL